METPLTETVDSSPASFEIPSDPKANAEWLKTGEMPAAAKVGTPKEASTPSTETASADASEEEAAETAATSATALKQEKTNSKSAAATRLNELLADLKKAGLSPDELKTFKRDAQAAATTPAPAAPEKTVNPQGLVEPVMPKQKDKNPDGSLKYPSWEELDEAKDLYTKELMKYTADQAVQAYRQQQAEIAQQQVLDGKVADAKVRYGVETEAMIGSAVRAIKAAGIAPVVEQFINESTVLPDVMYVLGTKADDLASFIELAKSDPGAALRKFTLLEHLVEQELAKGAGTAAAAEPATERDADGKFVSQTPPVKATKPAPPPPAEELSTRRSAPADAIDAAVRDNNFSAFEAEENRRDIVRRKGA